MRRLVLIVIGTILSGAFFGALVNTIANGQFINAAGRIATVTLTERPFNGTACTATPATFFNQINTINYDCGGNNIGFKHVYNNTSCNAGQTYRPDYTNFNTINDSNVTLDIGCYTTIGDYLNFTTNVSQPGPYVINLRAGDPNAGASWSVYVDNGPTPVTTIPISPVTGGYQVFQTFTSPAFTNVTQSNHIFRMQCNNLDSAGACGDLVYFQGAANTTCVNSGTNLCSLAGSFGPDTGVSSWMGRFWDFTAGLIGQNQCGLNYPVEQGADNPPVTVTYQQAISNDSGCVGSVYTFKTQNEWWLNCNATNPWNTTPGMNGGTCLAESQTPVTSPATYISNTCTMVNAIRASYPNVKVSWYGPSNAREAMFDPSGSCQIDAYEIHIYIYGDGIAGRTGMGDWNGGTPYSCGPSGGANGTLPHDVQCTASTALTFLPTWAAQHGNKPINVSEWCSAYGDTASPNGDDYATWAIANWIKANNVGSWQHWTGDPAGRMTPLSDCTLNSNNHILNPTQVGHLQTAMNHAFGGTHYAGTFYTFIPPPVPNPYP